MRTMLVRPRFISGRRRHRSAAIALSAMVIAAILLGLGFAGPHGADAVVPNQFKDSLVANVGSPTDISFTPDGRMLVTSQGGVLYVKGAGSPSVALDLSDVTCSGFERGLLGVTVDPEFTSNGFVYVFYTFAKFGNCSSNNSTAPVNRVSRFVMSGNTASRSTEFVVVDSMPSPNGNHNAGDILFGKDGLLYIAIGDGGCGLVNSGQCGGANPNARIRNILTGKILRVDRNGVAPSSNPFTGSNAGSCRTTGRTSLTHCRETFAWGLRNPFRIALDPNASGTRIYVNDVGQNVWEEIDELVAGADYGWNVREGFCANGSDTDCGVPPSGMRNPVFAYAHGSCNSITGGAFVPNGVWPATYTGVYLYADYVCGRIFSLNGSTSSLFASDLGPISTLQFGPSGSKQVLYYATYNDEVRAIEYTGQINRAPDARIVAAPTFGLSPLTVSFDARSSADPDNDPLTYRWNFGDGTPAATGATPSHVFTSGSRRVFTVTLTARDGNGATDTATIDIDVGNTAPVPTITAPVDGAEFSVGTDTIVLSGAATDAQDGTLPDASLSWEVKLHHDTHDHPYFSGTGNNISIDGPQPENLLAATNSYLVVSLTATDSTGLTSTVSRVVMPNKVNVTLESVPSGLLIEAEGETFKTPRTIVSWEGNPLELSAPDQVSASGEPLTWESWSVPGGQSFTQIVPATDTTVTATFALMAGPSFAPVADARVQESAPNTNDGAGLRLATRGNTSADSRSYLRFSVSGVPSPVVSAILFVYAESGSAEGPSVYRTSAEWSESRVTWNNRPSASGGKLDSAGFVASGSWVALDVTAAVQANGDVNFLLLSGSSDSTLMFSREAPDRQPRLVVIGTAGGDTSPPTTPGTPTAEALTSNSIQIAWGSATDDVGVTGYDIFRDGKLLTSTTNRRFTDNSVRPSASFTYAVRSRDAAGNVSPLSSPVTVSTPSLTRTLTFTAVADARVSEAEPSRNFGTSTQLRAEGGTDPDIEANLRFSVGGLPGSVYRAKLRLFVPAGSSTGTSDGPALYKTSTGWQELSITWSTKPNRTNTIIDDLGVVTSGRWVEYDVTAVISGNGPYGFALVSVSTDLVVFASRETSTPPQLIITARVDGTAGQAEVIPEPTPAATPVPTQTPTPSATPTPSVTLPPIDGFETGVLDLWTVEGGVTIAADQVKSGAFALRVVNSGGPGVPGIPGLATLPLGEPIDEVYVSFAAFLESRGSDSVDLATLLDSDGKPLATLLVDENGDLRLRNERSGRTNLIGAFTPQVWTSIQFRLVSRGGDSSAEVWVDGRLLMRDELRLETGDVAYLRFGDVNPEHGAAVVYDDVAVDRVCIGVCSTDLVTPEPSPESTATVAPVETAPVEVPTVEATVEQTPEPLPSPTETPMPEPTVEPQPTEPPAAPTVEPSPEA